MTAITPQRRYRPMSAAPKDGTVVWVNTFVGEVLASYVDCGWMREPFIAAVGVTLPGDAVVADCWRPRYHPNPWGDDDIEIGQALGWRPA